MNKRDYFLAALKAGACKKREWVNGVFAIVMDDPLAYKTDDYPYRLKRPGPDELVHYIDPTGNLKPITDSSPSEPLCRFDEALTIYHGDVGNYVPEDSTESLRTSYGRVLANHLCLVMPFGSIFPYENGYMDLKKIESRIEELLTDDPDVLPEVYPTDRIFVHQYLQYADNVSSLVGYSPLCVKSTSERSLSIHPKAREVRNQLVEKYKDRLTDPTIVARIGDELEKLDREWLKDDITFNYYLSNEKKLLSNVRKRMYYLYGGESAFRDGTTVDLIVKSLEEGIDTTKYPAMMNSLRYASYNRGAQTQLGGEATKTIYRMMGTVRITEDDCGTKVGIPHTVTEGTAKSFVGLYELVGNRSVEITEADIRSRIGNTIIVRGPLTCKTAGRNVCGRCMGADLSEHPDGLAAASAALTGIFLTSFLKSAHGRTLAVSGFNLDERLS